MTELALIASDPSALDKSADPAAFLIQACERAKDWLKEVLAHGDIEQIVELKSQAEAIRIYTMSKQLGHDAELAAAEVVRRAERGIGIAIRKGQDEGTVRKQGRPKKSGDGGIKSINELVADNKERTQVYAMTDGVQDEKFEEALDAAKEEGDLSRANVIRKVKGQSEVGQGDAGSKRPNRRPLAESFRDVAYKAMKAAESVQRLIEDDRWNKTAPKIDSISRDNLRRANQILTAAVNSLIEGER